MFVYVYVYHRVVVGSFDDLVAAQQDLARTTKVSINDLELLEELSQNVKYRKRNMKRKASSRILELWSLLLCPPSSKLSFKFQSEVSQAILLCCLSVHLTHLLAHSLNGR
jgi:hypothetical protein